MRDKEVEYRKQITTDEEAKDAIYEALKSTIETMSKGDLRVASVYFVLHNADVDCKVTLR